MEQQETLRSWRDRFDDATTLHDIGEAVRTEARARCASDGATFVLREGDKCFYADEDAIAPLWKGQRFQLSTCISGWAMLNARTAVVPDIETDDRIPLAAYRPTFVRSLAMAPVGVDHPRAAIGIYWARPHRATGPELSALSEIADAAAVALDRVGLEDAPWAPHFAED